jgi:ElaB/YqjD/DUF883 family membrane-anchored ribosome-binding protein
MAQRRTNSFFERIDEQERRSIMASSDRSTEALAEEVEALKREMASMKEEAAAEAATLMERAREKARALKESIAAGLRTGRDSTQACIQEHPISSVLIAFGVGLVAGGLIMRRRD